MYRIPLFVAVIVWTATCGTTFAAPSPITPTVHSGGIRPILITHSIRDLRIINNTIPLDKNKNLAYTWLATAVFFCLLEMLTGRLYAFSGCMAGLAVVIYVCLSWDTGPTVLQIGGWLAGAGSIRWFLPSWIRTHNDELRDRRRVAREAVRDILREKPQ